MATDEVFRAGFTIPLSNAMSALSPLGGGAEEQVGLKWLLRVRWGAVASQVAVLAVAKVLFAVELELGLMVGLLAFVGASNLILWVAPRPRGDWLTGAILVLDVLVLTALLASSGGATNPFTIFFLVHVALGALLLPPRAVWGLVALTVLAFGALFVLPSVRSLSRLVCGQLPRTASLHLFGMWVAYALAAAFVAHFLFKVSEAVRLRDRRLAEVAQQNERLASLSSFSANAAHELGTPLSTIALAAGELARSLREGRPRESLLSDAELVSAEVGRCRTILSGLSSSAGERIGEMPVRTTPGRLMGLLRRRLPVGRSRRLEVEFHGGAEDRPMVAPEQTLAEVLHNLVRNAFDAHDELGVDEPVVVCVEPRDGILVRVLDRGSGLDETIRTRLGQPFVTTRASQGGLGLGIYLAHSYATRTGGALHFASRRSGGTEVELSLSTNVLEERRGA